MGSRTVVNGQGFDLRTWEDEKAVAGDVVPSRASRKANGRLLQAVEAVGGHSLPQSKLRTSPRFLAPIFTLCDVLRTSFLFDLIYTLCYDSGMEPKSKKLPRKRITLVLRVDLIDRVLEKAKLLQQGPNNFVNLCVEGILDAMDAPGTGYDIPILSLYNQVKGRTFLTSKAVMAIVGALVPEVYDIDAQEQKFLMELVNKHEGRLTSEVFKGYRKLAQRMNMERIAHEKELKKLQSRQ